MGRRRIVYATSKSWRLALAAVDVDHVGGNEGIPNGHLAAFDIFT